MRARKSFRENHVGVPRQLEGWSRMRNPDLR